MGSKWSSECPGTPQNRPRSAPGAPRGILRAAFGQPKELPGAAKARISKPLQRDHHFRGPPGEPRAPNYLILVPSPLPPYYY